ncbi:amidohydrolase [Tuberibacillus sp. Marseille-P3662]|uniref:amidohydrolase n=1 Tax=Tuberibacillus sp. Marseille-P3662 TaxID=1965358 RepID=UPI000A1CBB1C|nr:amidohydrolase [Tuberibacillus sp. Marseille-P3662]
MKEIDLLITNANILTLDGENRKAGSVAVTNGSISRIWTERKPSRDEINLTQKTEMIDLKGATLLPGFIDTHNHILMYSQLRNQANCSTPPNKNISDILERIRTKADNTPKGQWVQGYGYDDTLLEEQRHPTREELDKIAPDHPVFVSHISAHLAVANSVAMDLAGIEDDNSDPQGGHFGRGNDGRLNGVLYEHPAMAPIQAVIPKPTTEKMMTLLGDGAQDYLAQGITTNTDAAVGMHLGESELEVHLKAAAQGVNPMRTQLMIMHTLLQENNMFAGYTAHQLDAEIRSRSNGKARLDSAKLFQDGSIQGLTGALRKPYYNEPDKVGELFHEQQVFNREIIDLHKRGFRIAIHGNGDRAIGSILEGYSNALNNVPRDDHRHRIEHIQTATPEDLDTMKNLGVCGSAFINHVYYWGDRHQRLFLGPERARRISPLRDVVERDLLFTLHSDCPVTPISPLFSVWAAVNRLTREGETLGPEQQIDVITALKSMTIYGAELIFDEKNTGSIEIGKRADFAVLEADPTDIDPKKIKDITVLATLIDGEMVYENKEMFAK